MPSHDPPQLFLVDGHALIYRAFFALLTRPLRTSRGENTSAAWGVVNFLLRLQSKYRPDYLVWVLDAGDSFRTARYPEYKSTRQKLGLELQADFDRAIEQVAALLAAFRVPVVSVDGYEADDVIGTLARREAAAGRQVVIVSGDKDFYQLIGSRIALLNPGRGGPAGVEEQWVDESNAAERLGVPPGQVTDYLALVGDTSDNVPGVRGIGEKGAVQLLQEFRDLDTLLARAGEVKAKRAREALAQNAGNARLSKELVTLKTDVPVALDLETAALREPDLPALLTVLARLEFHSLAKRLSETDRRPANGAAGGGEPAATPAGPPAASSGVQVTVVDDPSLLPELARTLRAAPLVALDTETSSLEPHDAELIGLCFAIAPGAAWYLPFGHRPPAGELAAPAPVSNLPPLTDPVCAPLAELLRDPAVKKGGHNIKYDWQVLRRAGIELAGVAYDSMLASFVLDPARRSHGIDTLALDHLQLPMRSYTDLTGKGRTQIPFAEVAVADAAAYCGADSATVLALREWFAPRLAEHALEPLLDGIEMPLVPVLVDMEWIGIAIDPALFARLSRELTADLQRLEAEIARAAGGAFNVNSPKQLATVLFEKLQLPVLKRTKTGPSTDADVLEELAGMGHEVPKLLLDYRELQKLRSTYVEVLPARVHPVTGRIHTSFNQIGAATGRLSSSEPNLQNIPVRTPRGEEIRRGFVPAPGWKFVVADYSQIELRLMAHLSGDPAFLEAFRTGEDIHRQTAAIIFGVPVDGVTPEMRARAKTINFGTIYGQGPFALSRQLGITQEEAKAFIAEYFTRFAGVRAFLDRQVELARERGYVETLFGRRRYIPEVQDRNFNVRAFGERQAQNAPLQGSAADLIKIAMARLHRALGDEGLAARLLLQVHDELVLEAPAAEVERAASLIRAHMEGAAKLEVPLVVDVGVGDNWLDAKN
ncbi:MAG TPA: DNA polymerase I [Gemmatimonadales bacterium]|jgi:DNA polymerase-1|nr:DNA polymerase I [Gemmatimonadales bacterium]